LDISDAYKQPFDVKVARVVDLIVKYSFKYGLVNADDLYVIQLVIETQWENTSVSRPCPFFMNDI